VSQFRYLGRLVSEERYGTKDTHSRIQMANIVFTETKKLFTGKMNLEVQKRIMK